MIDRINSVVHRTRSFLDTRSLPNLNSTEFWSADEILNFQSDRLVSIFRHHFQYSEAYRQLCEEHGLNVGSIRHIEDIELLPVVERKWLQNNVSARNLNYNQGETMHTGGSTGEPLEYMGCRRYHKMRIEAHRRGWSYFGLSDQAQFLILASAQGNVASADNISGKLDIPGLENAMQAIMASKKEFVRSYASSAYLVSMFMLQRGVKNHQVRSFNLISENVYDWQRSVIKESFPEAQIFEEYCCNDGAASAWECTHRSGLHEAFERAIIEPFDSGEMIVTDLWNRAMPFIRYRNGDRLLKRVTQPCDCGRRSPRITVQGRKNDILVTPSGPVSPTYLLMWGTASGYTGSHHKKGFTQIQYVQKPGYRLVVNCVTNNNYSEDDMDHLKEEVQDRIGTGMSVEMRVVEYIEESKSGKRQFIINEDTELLKEWTFISE